MAFFMVMTSIRFSDPPAGADGRPIAGAYQNIGVLVETESEIRAIVTAAVNDGLIDWSDSEIRRMDAEELQDEDFAPFVQDARPAAIWYMSGRCLYSDDE